MKNNSSRKIISALKLLLLAAIIIGIPSYLLIANRDLLDSFKNLDSLREVAQFLENYKTEGVFIYLGVQIAQIIISVVPGQIFQMAAGYLYGFFFALLLSCIGATIGSTIAYLLAVNLGHNSIKYLVNPEKLDYWVNRLNTKKAYIVVFLLYLIPGLPKDMVAYAAGIARMDLRAFLILSLVGRLPAMSASILIGVFYESGTYTGIWIVAGICVLLFILSILNREKLTAYFDKFYNKINV